MTWGIYHVKPKRWAQVVWIGELEAMAAMYARAQLIRSPYELRFSSVHQSEVDAWIEATNFDEVITAFNTFSLQGAVTLRGEPVGGINAKDIEFQSEIDINPGDEWRITHPAEVQSRVMGDYVRLAPHHYPAALLALGSVHHMAIMGWQLDASRASLKDFLIWLLRDSPVANDQARLTSEIIPRLQRLATENYWLEVQYRMNAVRFQELLESVCQQVEAEAQKASTEAEASARESVAQLLSDNPKPEDFSIL